MSSRRNRGSPPIPKAQTDWSRGLRRWRGGVAHNPGHSFPEQFKSADAKHPQHAPTPTIRRFVQGYHSLDNPNTLSNSPSIGDLPPQRSCSRGLLAWVPPGRTNPHGGGPLLRVPPAGERSLRAAHERFDRVLRSFPAAHGCCVFVCLMGLHAAAKVQRR